MRRSCPTCPSWPPGSWRRCGKNVPGEVHAACVLPMTAVFGLIDIVGSEGDYAVFGPVSAINCDNRRAQHILKRYGLPTTEAGLLLSYFKETATCTLLRFSDFLLLANYTLNRETLDITQLLPEDYQGEEEMLSAPTPVPPVVSTPHDANAYEREMYSLLRFGRYPEMLAFLKNSTFTGNQGSLADTMLRHQKNMVISSATLAARAAVDGRAGLRHGNDSGRRLHPAGGAGSRSERPGGPPQKYAQDLHQDGG